MESIPEVIRSQPHHGPNGLTVKEEKTKPGYDREFVGNANACREKWLCTVLAQAASSSCCLSGL